ncbi:MAG: hypothetical protein MKZ70_02155, partial [Opitutales bacterium]|nr:hypothetical protein [Opitutales bacterium]
NGRQLQRISFLKLESYIFACRYQPLVRDSLSIHLNQSSIEGTLKSRSADPRIRLSQLPVTSTIAASFRDHELCYSFFHILCSNREAL